MIEEEKIQQQIVIQSSKLSTSRLEPKIQQIDGNLYCVICADIINDPVECDWYFFKQLKNKSCRNLFCANCIGDWLEKQCSCPFRCKSFNFVKPHKKYIQLLGKITFSCKYLYIKYFLILRGCKELVTFNNQRIHEDKECKFSIPQPVPQPQPQQLENNVLNQYEQLQLQVNDDDYEKVIWFCYADDKLIPYDQKISEQIELSFQNFLFDENLGQIEILNIGNKYTIEFNFMVQINKSTSAAREIERQIL